MTRANPETMKIASPKQVRSSPARREGGRNMKIEKAIEVLTRLTTYQHPVTIEDRYGAMALGLEALKRLQDNRKDPEFDHWVLLPGETEE